MTTLNPTTGIPPNIDNVAQVMPYLNARSGGSSYVVVSPNGGPGGDGGDYGPNTPNTQTSGIQEALSAGSTVRLLAGRYTLHRPLTRTLPNLDISGAGKDLTTIVRANGQNSYMMDIRNASHVHISGITWDANSQNQSPNALLLGNGYPMILMNYNCSHITIDKCGFENVREFAILTYVDNAHIGSQAHDVKILDNYLSQVSTARKGDDCIVPTCSAFVVRGNYLSIYGGTGINVYESDRGSVSDNQLECHGQGVQGAISVSSSNEIAVVGNTIYVSTNDVGIHVLQEHDNVGSRAQSDSQVVGNNILGGDAGTAVQYDEATNNVLVGNDIRSVKYGVAFASGTISGVLMVGNQFSHILTSVLLQTVRPTSFYAAHNIGYNPPSVSSLAAGSSPYTFPALPYDAVYVLRAANGIRQLTLDGQDLAMTVGMPVFVGANHALTAAWALTAPVFEILPL